MRTFSAVDHGFATLPFVLTEKKASPECYCPTQPSRKVCGEIARRMPRKPIRVDFFAGLGTGADLLSLVIFSRVEILYCPHPTFPASSAPRLPDPTGLETILNYFRNYLLWWFGVALDGETGSGEKEKKNK